MKNEQAISLMKSSTSVKDWNDKRAQVLNSISDEQWDELHAPIDAYGLIVQVLGADKNYSRNIKTA